MVLAVIAPFFRYVIGETLEATGGSLLEPASCTPRSTRPGNLGFPGGWQFLPALLLLSVGIAIARKVRQRRGASK